MAAKKPPAKKPNGKKKPQKPAKPTVAPASAAPVEAASAEPPAPPKPFELTEVSVYVGGIDTVLAEAASGERRLSPGRNDGVPIALADHICGPGFGSAGTMTQRGIVKLFPDDSEYAHLNDQRVVRAEDIHAKFREKNAGRV